MNETLITIATCVTAISFLIMGFSNLYFAHKINKVSAKNTKLQIENSNLKSRLTLCNKNSEREEVDNENENR